MNREEMREWFRRAKNNPDYQDAITYSVEFDRVELTCVANTTHKKVAIFIGQHDVTMLTGLDVRVKVLGELAVIQNNEWVEV